MRQQKQARLLLLLLSLLWFSLKTTLHAFSGLVFYSSVLILKEQQLDNVHSVELINFTIQHLECSQRSHPSHRLHLKVLVLYFSHNFSCLITEQTSISVTSPSSLQHYFLHPLQLVLDTLFGPLYLGNYAPQ